MQQGGDPTVAISAMLCGQLDHGLGERCLVVGGPARLALRGPVLPQHTARRAFGHTKLRRHVLYGGPATGSAQ
jgi:hypothetical protein